jgi:hypothetical protein
MAGLDLCNCRRATEKNHDIPRPFIFRPPLNTATTYQPGQAFDFTLTLTGKAVHFLPYFILAFREVAREGIGLNRARCELDRVEALIPPRRTRPFWALPSPRSGCIPSSRLFLVSYPADPSVDKTAVAPSPASCPG